MSRAFDVVVIGGGPGGYVCAAQLAKEGRSVALIERGDLGGTCLNRGCIPTKTLLHAAEVLDEAKKAQSWGVHFSQAEIDPAAMLSRKEEVVQTLRQGVEQMLSSAGVTVLRGDGFVTAPGQVRVTGPEGETEQLQAGDIVVAAGSVPAAPPIPGMDLPGVVTSDQILSQLPQAQSLVIIGGGVIGMEFASLYASLGTKVTVLEGMARILPPLDREIGQSLAMLMKKRGAEIVTNAMVERIVQDGSQLCCAYSVKGKACTATGDAVLVAVGRRSLAQSVLAPELSVTYEKGRVVVDSHMESDVPHIYVIGDAAAGYPQLAHAASAQGLAAAAAIAGKAFDTDLALVPSCVYTQPEIASVGLTEAEAKERGLTVHTGKYPTSANGKSLLTGQERGFIKLVADENNVLLGAQLMCARATDMVGELALAAAQKMTVDQVAAMIRPHPTFEEAIGEAAMICAAKK